MGCGRRLPGCFPAYFLVTVSVAFPAASWLAIFSMVSTIPTLPNLFSALVKVIEAVLESYFTFLVELLIKM